MFFFWERRFVYKKKKEPDSLENGIDVSLAIPILNAPADLQFFNLRKKKI